MPIQKIFFSYSRTDGSDFALRLALDLKNDNYDVWIDQEDIRAGSEWDLEIEKALETSDCLLFIETNNSVISANVLDEVYYALEQKKKVIPLIVVESKTPYRLQRIQHIDFTRNYDIGLSHLIKELNGKEVPIIKSNEVKIPVKPETPFFKKYSGLMLTAVLLALIAAAIIIYSGNNKSIQKREEPLAANSTPIADQTNADNNEAAKYSIDAKSPTQKNEKLLAGDASNKTTGSTADDAKSPTQKNEKLLAGDASNKTTGSTADDAKLVEDFTGDWTLVGVEPKVKILKGHLKIEPAGANKVSIKSFFQFYYYKSNDTSFLNVFNGYAGCNACELKKDMKITAEDIAVGSQYYRILTTDQADGKAGDTVMNAGSNKSVRASVSLQLLDKKTVLIKVQKAGTVELSHGLLLHPFIYSFRFTKNED